MGLDVHRSIMMKIGVPEETMGLALCDEPHFCAIIAQYFYMYLSFHRQIHLAGYARSFDF
jgi:hypothetical protein